VSSKAPSAKPERTRENQDFDAKAVPWETALSREMLAGL